jgi:hypothetical protein
MPCGEDADGRCAPHQDGFRTARGFMKMLIGKTRRNFGFTAFGVEASKLMAAVQIAIVGRIPLPCFLIATGVAEVFVAPSRRAAGHTFRNLVSIRVSNHKDSLANYGKPRCGLCSSAVALRALRANDRHAVDRLGDAVGGLLPGRAVLGRALPAML